jgi:hypothetical protein
MALIASAHINYVHTRMAYRAGKTQKAPKSIGQRCYQQRHAAVNPPE